MCQTHAKCQQKLLISHICSLLAVLGLLATAGGCWQEIRYEPTETVQSHREAAVADVPSEQPEPSFEESPVTAEDVHPKVEEISPTPPAEPEPEQTANELPESSPSDEAEIVSEPEQRESVASVDPSEEGEDLAWLESAIGNKEQEPTAVAEPLVANRATTLMGAQAELASWRLSSDWSMAAALLAKRQGADRYAKLEERAVAQAKLMGIELPALPELEDESDAAGQVLSYLLDEAGPQLVDRLNDQHGQRCAALAELATKTHVLLLSYSPQSSRLEPVIAAIERTAEGSGLPPEEWQGLIDALTKREDYHVVKSAVFALHRRAGNLLSSAAEESSAN